MTDQLAEVLDQTAEVTPQTAQVIDLTPSRGWVTTQVLAKVWNVHPRKIQRMTVNGELPIHYLRLGREYRYPLADLNRVLTEHGGEPLTDADVAAIEATAEAS